MFKIISPIPVYMSGDKIYLKKYRPISVINHIPILFELIVLRNIQLSVNSVLVDEQYRFRPNRSATMNLIIFNNFILEAIENQIQVDVIFTDFTKAFEQVDHNILIEVL